MTLSGPRHSLKTHALLSSRVDLGQGHASATATVAHACEQQPAADAAAFAKGLGRMSDDGEPRATHRRIRRPYKTRGRMPSMLDPHLADIESWLAAEPKLTALVILGRLSKRAPMEFGPKQHSIVQRLLKTLRTKSADRLIAAKLDIDQTKSERPFEINHQSNIPP